MIEEVALNNLNERERHYINSYDSYSNGYNATKGGDGDVFDPQEEGEIIVLYLAGFTQTEIAEMFEVSITTIGRVLNKHEIQRNPKSFIDEEDFKKMYSDGSSLKDMANFFNVDMVTIRRMRNKLGLPKRLIKKTPNSISDIEKFKDDYLKGLNISDLASLYGVSPKTVTKTRNKLNLPKRRSKV